MIISSTAGFSAMNVIYPSGSNAWALAANGSTATLGVGLVVASYGNTYLVATHGVVEGISHGLGSAGKGWLSTAGGVTTTEPATGVKQKVCDIISATSLVVNFERISST